MRKNLLSLSIAAMIGGLGLAGSASAGVSIVGTQPNAVNGAPVFGPAASLTTATRLAPTADGVGHILLTPYFTTQNGNATLISITNTDQTNGKAVKVRFRGAANSDDVFDFQIYMSPGDVWTANVSQGADGRSTLNTSDNSCTIPNAAVLNSTPFVTARLPQTQLDAAGRANWTREGYIEVFNMADIPPNFSTPIVPAIGGAATTVNPLFTAIKHVNGVAPGCPTQATAPFGALGALAVDPVSELNAVQYGLNTPTSGLMGAVTVINTLGASVAWSSNMDALMANVNGFVNGLSFTPVPGRGRIVFSPQTALPAVQVDLLTNDPLLRTRTGAVTTPLIAANMFDLPDLSTPYVNDTTVSSTIVPSTVANNVAAGAFVGDNMAPRLQAINLSASLAVRTVNNEYLTNALIAAGTDWTFVFPTRRYATAMDYSTGVPTVVFNTFPATNVSPFFTAVNSTRSTANTNLICVTPGTDANLGVLTAIGRDEQSSIVTTGFVISPGGASPVFQFCGEASVIPFATTSVLSAAVATTTLPPSAFADGWYYVPTPGLGNGLPILGSSYQRATGPVVAGKSTNFSIMLPHRYTRQ